MEAATEKSVSRLPAMFRPLRHRNYGLFFSGQIISLPALHPVACSGGILKDAANVVIQHADPDHGPGRTARPRDGRLLNDVYGHGAVRRAGGGYDGQPYWSAHHCGAGRTYLPGGLAGVWSAMAQSAR